MPREDAQMNFWRGEDVVSVFVTHYLGHDCRQICTDVMGLIVASWTNFLGVLSPPAGTLPFQQLCRRYVCASLVSRELDVEIGVAGWICVIPYGCGLRYCMTIRCIVDVLITDNLSVGACAVTETRYLK